MKLFLILLHHTQKLTQNEGKDLNPETIKLLEENIGGKFLGIDLGNDFLFLDLNPQKKMSESKNKQRDYIKPKNSAQQKKSTK